MTEARTEQLELELALKRAREGLEYVLDHHGDGNECLCGAARSVAASSLRLSEAPVAAPDPAEPHPSQARSSSGR